ncbi:hypothetical protein CFC21_033833 [Triticum aestivum]|uniref:GTD-binding domain-containing protein n=3 Tax=Triticum TaxID=4564 RepID=A0A9R0VFL4_TRITD|nr:uncharacterized protein LOC123060063 [Triticum aestivum]KAF7020781.1 hypothetical protein CFC21_033833 [Triticum aestivum]VAH56530.1 unnamed protein product [Triticum turgidum subsp. durum]
MVRELLAVLVRAALQWALASLLLANGAAFCLIAAAASSLRLGPPCLLCARVHRLLCSSSSPGAGASQEQDAFRRLLCGAHIAAIAGLGAEETEHQACSASHGVDRGTKYDSDKPRGLESHRVVSIGSEICEQDRGGDDDQPRATNLSALGRTSSTDSGEGPYVSLFELAPLVALPEDTPVTRHGTTKPEHGSAPSSAAAGGEQALTVSGLVAALRAQRRELEAARAELHGERRARAELEEQGELDREAARVAMQLVHETETEKHELQRQLDAFRVRAQLHGREAAAASLDADYSASAPANRLGRRLSRDGDGELMEQEDEAGWGGNKNYQSLVDFLPGSVYSSSPDLANLLRLYTEGNGNGARRPKEGGITEEEEEIVVAVTATSVSGFDGRDGEEATSVAASLPESGGDHVRADLAQDEAAVMRA